MGNAQGEFGRGESPGSDQLDESVEVDHSEVDGEGEAVSKARFCLAFIVDVC